MTDLKISAFADGGAVEETDEIATNRGGVNTKVFVGSMASQDVGDFLPISSIGTSIGDIFTIVSVGGNPGLPVLDGSQLTNLPVQTDPTVKTNSSDSTAGYLTDKITNTTSGSGMGIILTVVNTGGVRTLNFSLRDLTTSASYSTGTRTVDIANGDFHVITVTGTITLLFSMANAQAVIVRGVGFDSYPPTLTGLDWGLAGAPAWESKTDFMVYRDPSGNYKAVLLINGVS